ncbi:MAG: hypothetical protein JW969_06260 [Spirochaetales bacterium]|nr:hypothetical protein [Spirochaetales bacterium]
MFLGIHWVFWIFIGLGVIILAWMKWKSISAWIKNRKKKYQMQMDEQESDGISD